MKRGALDLAERLGIAWEGLELWTEQHWRASEPMRARLCTHARRVKTHPLRWGSLYVLLSCALSMAVLDRPVAAFLKAHISGEIEGFFKTVTRLGEAQLYMVPTGIMVLGLAFLAWRAPSVAARRARLRLMVAPGFIFLTMAVSGLISNAIKTGLGRLRPRYWFEQGLYGFQPLNTQWAMNSFPSGHSQAAFAAMSALMVLYPRHAGLWLVIAVTVASSRVATTVHWLSDTMAGAWLSVSVTIVLARWFRAKGWLGDGGCVDDRTYSSHSPL